MFYIWCIIKNKQIMKTINTYFWNYEYRHYLRDASISKQNKVLRQFVNLGLDIDGASFEHLEIVKDIIEN